MAASKEQPESTTMIHRPGARVSLFALALLFVSALGCARYWVGLSHSQAVEQQAAQARNEVRVAQLNEAVTQQFDATARGVDAALQYLRVVYLRDREHFPDAVQEYLRRTPAGMTPLVMVMAADGHLAFNSDGLHSDVNLSDREHFQAHLQSGVDQVYFSQPVVGRILPMTLIPVSRPILDGGRFKGVISIPLRPEYLSEKFSDLRVAPEDLLAIVRNDGHFIARNHRLAEALKTTLPSDRPFLVARAGERGVFRDVSTVDQQPLLFSWRRLTQWPVSVVVAVNEASEQRVLHLRQAEERNTALVTMALVLSLTMLAAGLLLRLSAKSVQLLRSELQARAVFEASPVPSALYDESGQISFLNVAFVRTFGYDRQDLVSVDDWWLKAFPDAAYRQRVSTQWLARMVACEADGEVADFEPLEARVVCKDGETKSVVTSRKSLGPEFNGIQVVTLFDVTALRQSEQARRAAAQHARSLIEANLDPMVTINPEGKITDVNQATESATGLARSQLIGSEFSAYFTEPDRASASYREVFEQGQVTNFPLVMRHVEGALTEVLYSASVYRHEDGSVAGVVASARDVTQRNSAARQVERERLRLQTILQTASDGIHILDSNGLLIEANGTFLRMIGREPDDVGRIHISDWDDFEPPVVTLQKIHDILRTGKVVTFETRHRRSDGQVFPVEINASGIEFEGQGYVYAASRDITDRKKVESELRLAASVFANSYEGIVITDATNRIVDVNPAFSRITGYGRDEVLGRQPSLLNSTRQGKEFYARLWDSLMRQDFWKGEIWNRRKNGEVYAELLSIAVIRDVAGQPMHYIGAFTDISEIKSHEAELNRIAHYDTLTGAPNRRLLGDRLGQAIAHSRRSGQLLALCYLDLDGFKPVNDRFGHAVGDEVLVECTRRLKGVLREGDTLARLGGDEFVLLLTELADEQAYAGVLDRVLDVVSRPITVLDDQSVTVSASIGVSLFPRDASEADALLRQADQAMYRAKQSGKNRYQVFGDVPEPV